MRLVSPKTSEQQFETMLLRNQVLSVRQ